MRHDQHPTTTVRETGSTPLTGYPDNQTGNLDNAWFGGADRQTQHETGLHPAVDMGARQYEPALGRFAESDPEEGGCENDYVYPADPVNNADIGGRSACPRNWKWVRDTWVSDGWHRAFETGAFGRTLPANGISSLFGYFRIKVLAEWAFLPYQVHVSVDVLSTRGSFKTVWRGAFNGGLGFPATINPRTAAYSASRDRDRNFLFKVNIQYGDIYNDLNETLPVRFLMRAEWRTSICHWIGIGPPGPDQPFRYARW